MPVSGDIGEGDELGTSARTGSAMVRSVTLRAVSGAFLGGVMDVTFEQESVVTRGGSPRAEGAEGPISR